MKITQYFSNLTESMGLNVKLSYDEALKTQKEQAEHYTSIGFPKEAIDAVLKKTKPLPSQFKADEKISVHEINKLVPRGAAFESARDAYYEKHPEKKPKTGRR